MDVANYTGKNYIGLTKNTTNGTVSIASGGGKTYIECVNGTTNYNTNGVRAAIRTVGVEGMRIYFTCGFRFLGGVGNCYVGLGNAANINFANSHDLLMQNQVGAGAQFIKVAENGGVGHGAPFNFSSGHEYVDIYGEILADGSIDWYQHENDGTALKDLEDAEFTFMDNSPITDTFNAVGANLYFHFQAYDAIEARILDVHITDDGVITEVIPLYTNNFATLADFTTVRTDTVESSVTAVSSRARHRKTAAGSNGFDTLGIYSTAVVAARTLRPGDYFDYIFSVSNVVVRDFFALLKSQIGIVYNTGTFSAGMYAEGAGGGTQLRCWDNNTNRGTPYVIAASTDYRIRKVVNPDNTISIYAKLDSDNEALFELVGTTQTANAIGGATARFATNAYNADTDYFIGDFSLNGFDENPAPPATGGGNGGMGGSHPLLYRRLRRKAA